jgi:prepilin-type processing-associated H-X9-DG protein
MNHPKAITSFYYWPSRNTNSEISLSILVRRWVDDVNVFRCPSTDDLPIIKKWKYGATTSTVVEYSWFGQGGQPWYPVGFLDKNTGIGYYPTIENLQAKIYWTSPTTLPAGVVSDENIPNYPKDMVSNPDTFWDTSIIGTHPCLWSSYGYDDRAHFSEMKPGSARAADMRFKDSLKKTQSNHGVDGQNVLYWDGHVSFRDTGYASMNPVDNIYRCEFSTGQWNMADYTGSVLWGADTDAVILRTHVDGYPVQGW